jgi:hypothetical protein
MFHIAAWVKLGGVPAAVRVNESVSSNLSQSITGSLCSQRTLCNRRNHAASSQEESVSITRGFRLKTRRSQFLYQEDSDSNQEESVSITDYSIQTQNQEDSCSRSGGLSFYNKRIQTRTRAQPLNQKGSASTTKGVSHYRRILSSRQEDLVQKPEDSFSATRCLRQHSRRI